MKRLLLLFFATVSLMVLRAQTVAYDLPKTWEIQSYKGNMHVCGGPPGESSSRGHNCNERYKVEVIEYLPTYGVSGNENVYCSKCGKTMSRHIHVLK